MDSSQPEHVPYTILLPGIPVTSSRGVLGWCSVVLLQVGAHRILFDTGSYGDRQLLLDRLRSLDLTPRDIHTVFISHFHFDSHDSLFRRRHRNRLVFGDGQLLASLFIQVCQPG